MCVTCSWSCCTQGLHRQRCVISDDLLKLCQIAAPAPAAVAGAVAPVAVAAAAAVAVAGAGAVAVAPFSVAAAAVAAFDCWLCPCTLSRCNYLPSAAVALLLLCHVHFVEGGC